MDLRRSSTANFALYTCPFHDLTAESAPWLGVAMNAAGARGRGWTAMLNKLKEKRILVDGRWRKVEEPNFQHAVDE